MDNVLHNLVNKKYEDGGITIITPTGDRPEGLRRCKFYIERQTTNKPIQWIIADDSEIKIPYEELVLSRNGSETSHIGRKYPGDKTKSFRGNLLNCLSLIKYTRILVFEDDDWYSPEYCKIYYDALTSNQLFGEGPARYYNVRTRRYRILGNAKRASFCQTALRSEIIDKLYVSCQRNSAFVDARLWNKDCKKFVSQAACHCVGIKGIPGRLGIGMGHRCKSFTLDKEWKILEKWIGIDDAAYYRQFAKS